MNTVIVVRNVEDTFLPVGSIEVTLSTDGPWNSKTLREGREFDDVNEIDEILLNLSKTWQKDVDDYNIERREKSENHVDVKVMSPDNAKITSVVLEPAVSINDMSRVGELLSRYSGDFNFNYSSGYGVSRPTLKLTFTLSTPYDANTLNDLLASNEARLRKLQAICKGKD